MRQRSKIEPLILTMRKALESIAKKTLTIKLIIKTSKRKLNRVRTLNLSQKDFQKSMTNNMKDILPQIRTTMLKIWPNLQSKKEMTQYYHILPQMYKTMINKILKYLKHLKLMNKRVKSMD